MFGAETETSSDLEREGEKHKAPDEERRPVKTIYDTVAMASLTRDKEGEVFGAESADLEREEMKLEPAAEATCARNKTYVETKPAKAT